MLPCFPMRFFVAIACLCAVVRCWGAEDPAVRTSFFPKAWLDTLVSIEKTNEFDKIKSIGSGFLVGTKYRHILLVTAKHVATSDGKILAGLKFRLNLPSQRTILEDDAEQTGFLGSGWFLSTTSDVALRFLALETNAVFKTMPDNIFLSRTNLDAGAPLLVIGFPLGLRDELHSSPVVRAGVVARTDPTETLIDATILPGNSGGPVVYMPAVVTGAAIRQAVINRAMLIGLVKGVYEYSSDKTPDAVKHNSLLSIIVTSDEILALINREDVQKEDDRLPR